MVSWVCWNKSPVNRWVEIIEAYLIAILEGNIENSVVGGTVIPLKTAKEDFLAHRFFLAVGEFRWSSTLFDLWEHNFSSYFHLHMAFFHACL